MEGSGTVIAVGSEVTDFQVGDKVYGAEYEKPILTRPPAGWCSEYVVTEAKFLQIGRAHV